MYFDKNPAQQSYLENIFMSWFQQSALEPLYLVPIAPCNLVLTVLFY